jgi:autotransporter-associated beta strand protein
MGLSWRGLARRIADRAALGFQARRGDNRRRRSGTLRLQTEALESRNMLASHPLLVAGHRPHTAAPAVHHSAPAHIGSTSGGQTLTTAGTLRLSAPSPGSAGATLAVGAVSIQGGTTINTGTINTGTLTLSAVNTYTGGVTVANGTLGAGTTTVVGGTLTISSAVTNTGTIALTGGATSLIVNTGGFSAPTLGNNSSLTISGGTLRFNNTVDAATFGTGVIVSGTGTLELAGTVSTLLSPNVDRVHIVNLSSQLSTIANGEAGWLHDTGGSTVVNLGADLTANHIVQNALVIGNAPSTVGLITISASDASGYPLAYQLQPSNPFGAGLYFAGSLAPVDSALTLAPPVTSVSPPAVPYYWNQPG